MGTIHLYGFHPDALGDLPIETDEETLIGLMETDERLPAEWFRICEYVSLFPRTENLSLYVDSKAGVKGLSFAFALEACYLGLKEETIYTGDSSPLYNFLPTDSISVAHMRAKASIMSDTDVGYRNMIMKNPISLMSTDE